MRITLTVTAGPHKGREFSFAGHDTFIVGRSPKAHFQLPPDDRYFSRMHFLVEVNPPQCRLMDLGSRNGTYVNGEKVTATDLWDGDSIKAGRTLLSVTVVSDPAESLEAAPAEPAADPVVDAPIAPPADRWNARRLEQSSAGGTSRTGEKCCVCGRALVGAAPLSTGAPPLCPTCTADIRQQPQSIPGYLLVRQLGQGGMGVVYLALRRSDGSLIALKTITPAVTGMRNLAKRFLREAEILRQLSHPHIVAFHEMGDADDRLFFAMEHVPGTDACQLVEQHGPLPVGRAVRLTCQLLQALEHAHAQGFVHRDIKPPNLLVTTAGGREVVKLADFGLARVYQSSRLSGLTLAGDMGGTFAFMAPEQITNFREVLPTVDQYATAATLYYLLTGELIYDFPERTEEQVGMILQQAPVPIQARRTDLSGELAAIIHRALAREPAKRFPNVQAMSQALLPSSV
jgi:hypothetical protein